MSGSSHNPCATCQSHCCRSYIVTLCGYDVWLISTRLHLGPEQFVVPYPQHQVGLDGFRLEADGTTFALMLDKQGRLRVKQPCVFLVRLAGGHDRCGIYPIRPAVCRTYPMMLERGEIVQRADALCPPGVWPEPALRWPAWREAQRRLRMHFAVYHEVVARWNARVAATSVRSAAGFSAREYLSYVLNVYDRLAALDAELGDDALARAQITWATWTPTAVAEGVSGEVRLRCDELPWLEYLSRARQVIDTFYPDVPPLPLQVPVPADEAAPPAPIARPGSAALDGAEQAQVAGQSHPSRLNFEVTTD
ncbi:MAG: YkgJ family cysteine cluster protein [Chloroflexi bacterium]|nr:YkgJ family cysteine cluster protein [Chloroflexota bacterium]